MAKQNAYDNQIEGKKKQAEGSVQEGFGRIQEKANEWKNDVARAVEDLKD